MSLRKCLCLILAASMALSVLPTRVFAAVAFTVYELTIRHESVSYTGSF